MNGAQARWLSRQLGVAVVAFLAVLLGWRVTHEAPHIHGRAPAAPAFTIESLSSSGRVELASYAGRVVVLNFWASWCGPCRAELPELEAAWRRWHEDVVSFVGVDVRDSVGDAKRSIARAKITYPVGHDQGRRVESLYDLSSLPQTFVIAPDGRVAAQFAGSFERARLDAAIAKALGGSGGSATG